MKDPIRKIIISISNLDVYHVTVMRENEHDEYKMYDIKAESIALDALSRLINNEKVKQTKVSLSVYPVITLVPVKKVTAPAVSKKNYDPSQSRVDLCQSIKTKLDVIHREIKQARENELTFARNDEVDPQDFDNLFHQLSQLYRLCDHIEMELDDSYRYSTQRNFD